MSSEKMREEFENWHRSVVTGEPPHEKYNDGDYMNQHVQRYWLGWQASREVLVIELPEPYAVIGDYAACGGGRAVWDVDYAEKIDDRMCQKTDVYDRASLEAAGLRMKP